MLKAVASSVRNLIFAALVLLVVFFAAYTWWLRRPEYKINSNRDAVITQIKKLSRLETASFTIEKIIDAGTTGSQIQNFLFGDRLLLIAHGEVIGGFDLSKLNEEDVEISGDAITLTLPPPEILVSSLDNSKTRVYDRTEGILNLSDKDLESEARKEAEDSIRKAACEGGLMQEAADNARSQLTSLLNAFGFSEVSIVIPSGECR